MSPVGHGSTLQVLRDRSKQRSVKRGWNNVSVLFRRNQRIYHSAELLPFSASRCLESPKSLYFETFWKRNYSDQSWLPLNKGSSFTAKRGITTALTEMGYEETLLVDGKTIKSTLWFYGELDPCNLGNNTH